MLWWKCRSPVAHSCSLLNHLNGFCGGMFKLNAKFDADSLLYLLSHFECDSHAVHMLTQWRLPPPLTSTVKSSLFTHALSSPFFLTARLQWCCTNHSLYVSNGWTFSRHTSYSERILVVLLCLVVFWRTRIRMRTCHTFGTIIPRTSQGTVLWLPRWCLIKAFRAKLLATAAWGKGIIARISNGQPRKP